MGATLGAVGGVRGSRVNRKSCKNHLFFGATLLQSGQGGIALVARLTVRALAEMEYAVELLSLLDTDPVEVAGITCTTTRGNRLAYVVHCHLAALKHRRFIYDSINMAQAHPRFVRFTLPYAVWMHGIESWYHLSRFRKQVLRQAELVLVNSHFTLNRFQELHGPLENARVCYLATEQDEPPAILPDFQGPPTVLILGRQDKNNYYKGHRELIECWPRVVNAVPDARLVIAGGGDGLHLTRQLVTQSPVADQIEVLGFVPDEKLPAVWQRAHLFAMPSRKEGFGLVYIEAMRYSLPVIASVHDAGQEVNLDGMTGFNVDLDKKTELSDRIVELLRDSDLAHSLGRAAQDRWHGMFRYSYFMTRINAILET